MTSVRYVPDAPKRSTYFRYRVTKALNDLTGLGAKWTVVQFYGGADRVPPEFHVVLPIAPDGSIDFYSWFFARERAVVIRPSDGAEIGRAVYRGQWTVQFEPGLGGNVRLPEGRGVTHVGRQAPDTRYLVASVRREGPVEPSAPQGVARRWLRRLGYSATKVWNDLRGRRPVWTVVRYCNWSREDDPLREFDLVVPAAPDGLIDFHAWFFARERCVATRTSDGAQVGRLERRGRDWVVEFTPGQGAERLRLGGAVGEGAPSVTPCRRYDAIRTRPVGEPDLPPPPPPLEVRGPGWFVIRYVSNRGDSPLPEFDLTVPADAAGNVDFDAWKAERERTTATRSSDGARVGLFLRAGHHWMIEFEPGLGPSYVRMADKAGGGMATAPDDPCGHYRAVSFAPVEA